MILNAAFVVIYLLAFIMERTRARLVNYSLRKFEFSFVLSVWDFLTRKNTLIKTSQDSIFH